MRRCQPLRQRIAASNSTAAIDAKKSARNRARELAHHRRVLIGRQRPAKIARTEGGKIIRYDPPAGVLREHVNIPATPARLAVNEKRNPAQHREQHHENRRAITRHDDAELFRPPPAFGKERPHHWISGAREPDDARRRKNNPMRDREHSRRAPFSRVPVRESHERREKERLRITGHEIKRCRMRDDGKGPKSLQRQRQLPAFTEEKKISPKCPGRRLRRYEERIIGVEMSEAPNGLNEQRIGWEKRYIRHLHFLMSDRRERRPVAATDDVREPIAIVLHEGAIAIGPGARRGIGKSDCERDLRDRHEQPEAETLERGEKPKHGEMGARRGRDQNVRCGKGVLGGRLAEKDRICRGYWTARTLPIAQ